MSWIYRRDVSKLQYDASLLQLSGRDIIESTVHSTSNGLRPVDVTSKWNHEESVVDFMA
jgi:hypothetical protein